MPARRAAVHSDTAGALRSKLFRETPVSFAPAIKQQPHQAEELPVCFGLMGFCLTLLRPCLKNVNTPNGESFSTDASLISLEIRQDSCGKSPRPVKKSLAAGHSVNFQTRPNERARTPQSHPPFSRTARYIRKCSPGRRQSAPWPAYCR